MLKAREGVKSHPLLIKSNCLNPAVVAKIDLMGGPQPISLQANTVMVLFCRKLLITKCRGGGGASVTLLVLLLFVP